MIKDVCVLFFESMVPETQMKILQSPKKSSSKKSSTTKRRKDTDVYANEFIAPPSAYEIFNSQLKNKIVKAIKREKDTANGKPIEVSFEMLYDILQLGRNYDEKPEQLDDINEVKIVIDKFKNFTYSIQSLEKIGFYIEGKIYHKAVQRSNPNDFNPNAYLKKHPEIATTSFYKKINWYKLVYHCPSLVHANGKGLSYEKLERFKKQIYSCCTSDFYATVTEPSETLNITLLVHEHTINPIMASTTDDCAMNLTTDDFRYEEEEEENYAQSQEQDDEESQELSDEANETDDDDPMNFL